MHAIIKTFSEIFPKVFLILQFPTAFIQFKLVSFQKKKIQKKLAPKKKALDSLESTPSNVLNITNE